MKAFKIDRFTPAPQGMRKVHVHGYYMAYPDKKARAPANKKAPAAKAPSKNVTVRKPPKKPEAAFKFAVPSTGTKVKFK
jgi:hypothetical protein